MSAMVSTSVPSGQNPPQSSNSNSRQPGRPILFDFIGIRPLFDSLGSHLSISDIANLTRACNALSTLYQDLLPSQWNVDKVLRRFINNPQGFRSQIGKCDALVSGSLALQFFERVCWHESDMDVFVEVGSKAEELEKYVIQTEGYEFVSIGLDHTRYRMTDLDEIRTYTRQKESDAVPSKVQIVTTDRTPIQAILRGFYTSAIVNVLTWNKAYSLFPLPTFIRHKTFLFRGLDEYHAKLVRKYRQRGWMVQPKLWREGKTLSHPLVGAPRTNGGERRVGDRFSWIIPFNLTGIQVAETPDSVIEYCNFGITDLGAGHSHEEPEHYNVCATMFDSKVRLYQYTYSYPTSRRWLHFLAKKTNELTRMELLLIDPADRPANFDDMLERYGELYDGRDWGDHPVPADWRYYDDRIPIWYNAYQGEQKKRISGITGSENKSTRYWGSS